MIPSLILFYSVIFTVYLTYQIEAKKSHRTSHDFKPITFGTLSDTFFENNLKKSQQFFKHQLRSRKNRGWRHGRRQRSSEEEEDDQSESKEVSRDRSLSDPDEIPSSLDFEQQFRKFIKEQNCGDSDVYKKFLYYYKQAMAILQKRQKELGDKQEYSETWLLRLANEQEEKNCVGVSCGQSSVPSGESGVAPVKSVQASAPVKSVQVAKEDSNPNRSELPVLEMGRPKNKTAAIIPPAETIPNKEELSPTPNKSQIPNPDTGRSFRKERNTTLETPPIEVLLVTQTEAPLPPPLEPITLAPPPIANFPETAPPNKEEPFPTHIKSKADTEAKQKMKKVKQNKAPMKIGSTIRLRSFTSSPEAVDQFNNNRERGKITKANQSINPQTQKLPESESV